MSGGGGTPRGRLVRFMLLPATGLGVDFHLLSARVGAVVGAGLCAVYRRMLPAGTATSPPVCRPYRSHSLSWA